MIRSLIRNHETSVVFPSWTGIVSSLVSKYCVVSNGLSSVEHNLLVMKEFSPYYICRSSTKKYHTLLCNARRTLDTPACNSANINHNDNHNPRTGTSSYRYRSHPVHLVQCRSFEYLIDPKATPSTSKKDRRNKTKGKKSWNPSNRFIDRIRIQVQGGRGGKGSLSSEQVLSRKFKLRPDGGHGGNGGCIFLVANEALQGLRMSKKHFVADSGKNGTSKNQHGRSGRNLIIHVPTGVLVKRILNDDEIWDEKTKTIITTTSHDDSDNDDDSDDEFESNRSESFNDIGSDDEEYESDDDDDDKYEEIWDDSGHDAGDVEYVEVSDSDDEDYGDGNTTHTADGRAKVDLADLNTSGSYVLVARGGQGGLGTCNYANRHGPLPDTSLLVKRAQPIPAEVVHLELELKLIADVGLVGFPNAGKSSLLRAISAATPAVAPYPFTTLRPILGCVDFRDGYRIRVADIPGLIDGASIGRGKGFEFLRHIERTKVLLYIVDAAGVDARDPINDLFVLANELEAYGDGSLLDRRAIVVANKLDLFASSNSNKATELLSNLSKAATEIGIQFSGDTIGISAGVTGEGLGTLTKELRRVVTLVNDESDPNYSSYEKKVG